MYQMIRAIFNYMIHLPTSAEKGIWGLFHKRFIWAENSNPVKILFAVTIWY